MSLRRGIPTPSRRDATRGRFARCGDQKQRHYQRRLSIKSGCFAAFGAAAHSKCLKETPPSLLWGREGVSGALSVSLAASGISREGCGVFSPKNASAPSRRVMGGESSRRTQMLLGVGLVGLIVGLVMLVAGAATGWLLPDGPPKANLLRNQSAKVGEPPGIFGSESFHF